MNPYRKAWDKVPLQVSKGVPYAQQMCGRLDPDLQAFCYECAARMGIDIANQDVRDLPKLAREKAQAESFASYKREQTWQQTNWKRLVWAMRDRNKMFPPA